MSATAQRAPRFVPVEAKLRPPALTEDLAFRGVLVDRLIDAESVPLVVVTGPPGYGKSVAVAQWAHADVRPFAWVTLDEDDDEPMVFTQYLVEALRRIGVVESDRIGSVRPDQDTLEHVTVPLLGKCIARSAQPFVLVADGTEALRSTDRVGRSTVCQGGPGLMP